MHGCVCVLLCVDEWGYLLMWIDVRMCLWMNVDVPGCVWVCVCGCMDGCGW